MFDRFPWMRWGNPFMELQKSPGYAHAFRLVGAVEVLMACFLVGYLILVRLR
jgi:hypothetical protein